MKLCAVSNPDIKDKIDVIYDNKPLFVNLDDDQNEILRSTVLHQNQLALNITINH